MFNVVVITGRLTADPELKSTQNGKMVTSFCIANDVGFGDSKKTNFINIVAWKKTAEFVCKYFSKGSMIGIRGEIQTRQWKDQNGNNRMATEIIANDVQFMEKKDAGGGQIASNTQAADIGFTEVEDNGDLPF